MIGSGFGLTVSAEDPYGNVDTSFSGSVNVALSTNPVGATLGGTLSVSAQSGVAAFSGLTLDQIGNWVHAPCEQLWAGYDDDKRFRRAGLHFD